MLSSPFTVFVAALAFFHTSEVALAVAYNRHSVGWHSLLFSWPYTAAMSLACLEYAAELWATPGLKHAPSLAGVQLAGLALVLVGDGIRKAAIVTAAHNFTHTVQLARRPHHVLVRHGVYTYLRHPAYFGWFLWAVGTQVLLLNPVCTVVFAAVAWLYFKRRITFEEARLLEFFGREYVEYRDATRTWIPGIAYAMLSSLLRSNGMKLTKL